MTVCYEIVKAKTEAKRAKEATAKQNKEQRQKRRQQTCADQNALGGQIVAALTHQGQIRTLLVPQLRAALSFRGITPALGLKKAELVQKLSENLSGLSADQPAPRFRLPESAPASAPASEPEAAASSDSVRPEAEPEPEGSDDESDSGSSSASNV